MSIEQAVEDALTQLFVWALVLRRRLSRLRPAGGRDAPQGAGSVVAERLYLPAARRVDRLPAVRPLREADFSGGAAAAGAADGAARGD